MNLLKLPPDREDEFLGKFGEWLEKVIPWACLWTWLLILAHLFFCWLGSRKGQIP